MSIEATIKARILPHQHSDSQWAALDCWLGSGEEGFNTTNRKKKTGPGHWNSLPYDEAGGGTGSGPANTDELPEGSTNRYFTDARADARANARIAAADLVPKAATSTAGFAFVDNDETLAAGSATKLATQRAVRLFVLAKFAELIAAAPAELDTWLELVAAIENNHDALAGIVTALADRLLTAEAPELIRDTIAAALVEGSNVTIAYDDTANTITVSVPDTVEPPLVYDAETGWPARPDVSFPVFWVGGDAPEDAPPALGANDVWIPKTGDNVDLGQIVESLQMLVGTPNTIPYFSALKTFGALALKTLADAYSDTAILTEKAVREYVDKLKVVTYTATRDLAASDVGKVVEYDATVAGTFTLPAGVMQPDEVMHFRTINTGVLTIAGAGVVAKGNKLKLSGQWTEASLHCRAAGSYVLTGDLVA